MLYYGLILQKLLHTDSFLIDYAFQTLTFDVYLNLLKKYDICF